MPHKDPEKRRAYNRMRNQDPKYKEYHRLRQLTENMTPEQIERRKKRQQEYHRRSGNKQRKERRHIDESYRIVMNMRRRMNHALKGNLKDATSLQLCGCTIEFLAEHLRSPDDGQIYHIDHVRPCKTFDLSNPIHQRVCFHWTNLQILSAEENLKKGAQWNPLKYGGLRLHIAQVEALHTGNLEVLDRLFINEPIDGPVSSVG